MNKRSIWFRAEKFDAGQFLDCAILNDETHVVFKTDVARALQYAGKSQNWLPEFLLHISRFIPVSADLIENVSTGISIDENAGTSDLISVSALLETCQMILQARDGGFLFVSELPHAKAAQALIENHESTDWRFKIEKASGFALFKQNNINSLVRYFAAHADERLAQWILSIPEDLWIKIFRNKGWKWNDLHAKPHEISEFVYDALFARLPETEFDALMAGRPKRKYNKPGRPQEFLPTRGLTANFELLLALLEKAGSNNSLFSLLLDKSAPSTRKTITFANPVGNGFEKFSAFEEKISKALGPKPRF